jgi:hypothetical protein
VAVLEHDIKQQALSMEERAAAREELTVTRIRAGEEALRHELEQRARDAIRREEQALERVANLQDELRTQAELARQEMLTREQAALDKVSALEEDLKLAQQQALEMFQQGLHQRMQLNETSDLGKEGEEWVSEVIQDYLAEATIHPVGKLMGQGDLLVEIDTVVVMIEVKNRKVFNPADLFKYKRDLTTPTPDGRRKDAGIFVSLGDTSTSGRLRWDLEVDPIPSIVLHDVRRHPTLLLAAIVSAIKLVHNIRSAAAQSSQTEQDLRLLRAGVQEFFEGPLQKGLRSIRDSATKMVNDASRLEYEVVVQMRKLLGMPEPDIPPPKRKYTRQPLPPKKK